MGSLDGNLSLDVEMIVVPPPTKEVRAPQHPTASPQSPSSLSTGSSRKRQRPGQVRVVVRIRPLCQAEKDSSYRCCIRPVLTRVVPAGVLMGKSLREATSSSRKRSPRQVLSPVSTNQRQSPRRAKNSLGFQGNDSRKLVSTRLISGTENKVKFDFDQVIGPRMSQAQCYERALGDAIKQNISNGVDTTILAVGIKESGKSHTMSGGWKLHRSSERKQDDRFQLPDEAGILPRAIFDLFQACENGPTPEVPRKIMMSFYMVASDGRTTFDLLSKFRHPSKELLHEVVWLEVGSPQGVKRLMDRASEKRAKYTKKDRKEHLFCSFRIVSTGSEGVSSKTRHNALKLTFAKLVAPDNISSSQNVKSHRGEYNLREIIHALCIEEGEETRAQAREDFGLGRRLDEVIQKSTSTIIVGCVSPVDSDIERSMDLLRLLAMATKATYSSQSQTNSDSINQELFGATSNLKNVVSTSKSTSVSHECGDASSLNVLQNLKKALKQAGEAAKGAQASSQSLNTAAAKWRSHRKKLGKVSSLAALSEIAAMNDNATDGVTQSKELTILSQKQCLQSSSKQQSRPLSTKTPVNTYKQLSKAPSNRGRRRHGPKLLQQKEEMKTEINSLKREDSKNQGIIHSLGVEIGMLSKQLLAEQEIGGKLEQIRSILKRKTLLQAGRIRKLEQQLSNATETNRSLRQELDDSKFALNGERRMKEQAIQLQTALQQNYNDLLKEFNTKKIEADDDHSESNSSFPDDLTLNTVLGALSNLEQARETSRSSDDAAHHKLLSLFDDSTGDASIFFDAEDAGSKESSESMKSSVLTVGRSADKSLSINLPCDQTGVPSTMETVPAGGFVLGYRSKHSPLGSDGGPISNLNARNDLFNCSCQSSLLSSGNADSIEFYLPSLSVACLCGKQQAHMSEKKHLGHIDAILRPWQADFLSWIGVAQIEEFLEVYENGESELASLMMKWRKQQGLPTMPKKACSVALLIWSRTCAIAIRSTRSGSQTGSSAERKQPDLVELCSMDSGRLSSIGVGSNRSWI